MCGLIFLYRQGLDDKALLDTADRSLAEIEHRGPDDKGIWCGQSVVIGHRHLSIIDLAASRQPMTEPSERFILTYNGEV